MARMNWNQQAQAWQGVTTDGKWLVSVDGDEMAEAIEAGNWDGEIAATLDDPDEWWAVWATADTNDRVTVEAVK